MINYTEKKVVADFKPFCEESSVLRVHSQKPFDHDSAFINSLKTFVSRPVVTSKGGLPEKALFSTGATACHTKPVFVFSLMMSNAHQKNLKTVLSSQFGPKRPLQAGLEDCMPTRNEPIYLKNFTWDRLLKYGPPHLSRLIKPLQAQ